jgi:hypothetical protein
MPKVDRPGAPPPPRVVSTATSLHLAGLNRIETGYGVNTPLTDETEQRRNKRAVLVCLD